jgi:tetratricopeptide (TPR) repeat protein
LEAGAVGDAETTIRRAIAIDPSDGEQGQNDRMRAYAVLADILVRKGDEAGARTYRTAVDAIRISEKADEFHEAGLYERAFKGYRDALEQFSDAYCIQSRLAVQLDKQGRRAEALQHYRRAYELMPDSFGRVESHCFGCESVFQDAEAQSVAEQVFQNAIRKSPAKAQAYYLIAYLREQQQRPGDAVQPLRQAVSLDPRYLNAWVHLYRVGEHTYIEPGEMDIARLKLLELDPLQRHASYSVTEVGDLAALWRGAERAHVAAKAARPRRDGVYALRASTTSREEAMKSLPPEMRGQMDVLNQFQLMSQDNGSAGAAPAKVLNEHDFVKSTRALMGLDAYPDY